MTSNKRKYSEIENEDKDTKEKSDMNIDNLPNELLLHIFRFLPQFTVQGFLTKVSNKWLNVIRNDTLLSGELSIVPSKENINSVLKDWPKLQVLKIPINEEVKAEALKNVDIKLCPDLQKVEIFFGHADKKDIFKQLDISKHAENEIIISYLGANPIFLQTFQYEEITEIQCSVMKGGHFRIDNLESKFSTLVQNFPNLTKIIVDNGKFDNPAHKNFMRKLENRQYWNEMVIDFMSFVKSDVMQEIRKKIELEIRLKTISPKNLITKENISMNAFKSVNTFLMENKKLLRSSIIALKVNGITITRNKSYKLTIEFVQYEFMELNYTEEAILGFIEEIGVFLKKYESPKSLDLVNMTKKGFMKLLTNIDISKCEKITLDGNRGEFFVGPIHINHFLRRCKKLKELNIVSQQGYRDCGDLDFKAFFQELDIEIKKLEIFSYKLMITSMGNTSFDFFMDIIKKKFHPGTLVEIEFTTMASTRLKIERDPFKEPLIKFKC